MAFTNRLTRLFSEGEKKLLSVYFTAGFPELQDTVPLCRLLEENGVDLIEIGFPFSDSLVDGPTIQAANERALKNGMSMELLFEQLADIRSSVGVPLVLMSCVNPLLCYGMQRFAADCGRVGLDGVIIPDLPPEYMEPYRKVFEECNLSTIFLVTAHTPPERIRMIDGLCGGFIYAVSSDATTGNYLEVGERQREFFKRLAEMHLSNPFLVGFGVSDAKSFERASKYSRGAIIGSAFIRALLNQGGLEEKVGSFIGGLRPVKP